jgi:hypothetical protein
VAHRLRFGPSSAKLRQGMRWPPSGSLGKAPPKLGKAPARYEVALEVAHSAKLGIKLGKAPTRREVALEVAHPPKALTRLHEAPARYEVALEVAQCVRLRLSSAKLRRGMRWRLRWLVRQSSDQARQGSGKV